MNAKELMSLSYEDFQKEMKRENAYVSKIKEIAAKYAVYRSERDDLFDELAAIEFKADLTWFKREEANSRKGGAIIRMIQCWIKKYQAEDAELLIDYIKRQGGNLFDYISYLRTYASIYRINL